MDDIHIITRIKEQQQIVMESFVKHIRRAVAPGLRLPVGKMRPSSSWELLLQAERDVSEDPEVERKREVARLTLSRADHLLRNIQDRIDELNTLLENAESTSAAVSRPLRRAMDTSGKLTHDNSSRTCSP